MTLELMVCILRMLDMMVEGTRVGVTRRVEHVVTDREIGKGASAHQYDSITAARQELQRRLQPLPFFILNLHLFSPHHALQTTLTFKKASR